MPENDVAVIIPLVASIVIAVPTFTTLLKVAAVPVIMLSVEATPTKPEPSPENEDAVTTPVILMPPAPVSPTPATTSAP